MGQVSWPAAAGRRGTRAGTEAVLVELRAILPSQPGDRLVVAPGESWLLMLPDFLVTRLVEFTVHADDLPVSVGIQIPTLPAQVTDTVLVLLPRLAGGAPTRPQRGAARAQPRRARAHDHRGV